MYGDSVKSSPLMCQICSRTGKSTPAVKLVAVTSHLTNRPEFTRMVCASCEAYVLEDPTSYLPKGLQHK